MGEAPLEFRLGGTGERIQEGGPQCRVVQCERTVGLGGATATGGEGRPSVSPLLPSTSISCTKGTSGEQGREDASRLAETALPHAFISSSSNAGRPLLEVRLLLMSGRIAPSSSEKLKRRAA
jgi:hypothetical protein